MRNKIITFDDWLDQYKPIQNHINPNEEERFETYGEDLEFIRTQPVDRVWTLVCSGNDGYIIPGLHIVNRLNYYVTEVPHNNDNVEVLWDEYTGDYPVRELIVQHRESGIQEVIRVSTQSVEDGLDLDNEEDEGFDDMIYFYCDAQDFNTMSGEELVKNLDAECPYIFIKEV
jgi:hypothetical protein